MQSFGKFVESSLFQALFKIQWGLTQARLMHRAQILRGKNDSNNQPTTKHTKRVIGL